MNEYSAILKAELQDSATDFNELYKLTKQLEQAMRDVNYMTTLFEPKGVAWSRFKEAELHVREAWMRVITATELIGEE